MTMCVRLVLGASIALGVCAGAAHGQIATTVPAERDGLAGNARIIGVIGDHVGATVAQGFYSGALLADIPKGSVITAIQLRLNSLTGFAPWPVTGFTVSDFRVTLAQTNKSAATLSSTFADNLVSPVQVRSGGLALGTNAYPAGVPSGVAAWGPAINFQTPYVYQGGPLVMEIRNSGGASNFFGCDGVLGVTADTSGWMSQNNINATTGSSQAAPIIRVQYYPPADLPSMFGSGITKVYVAPSFAELDGSANLSTPLQTSPRTFVSVMDQSMFDALGPGSWFRGMAFKSVYTYDWPLAAGTYSKYDVQLGRSLNPPGLLSATVASNQGPDTMTVRSGALNIAAGAMYKRPAGTRGEYSWEIPFQNAYPYKGGNLLSSIRHDGAALSVPLVDGVAQSDGIYNRLVQSKSSVISSVDPVTATNSAFALTRYSVDAQTIVPLAAANGPTASTNNGNAGPISGDDSKYQVIVASSELKHIAPGSLITSLSFQNLQSAAAWPGASGSYCTDYTIELSDARRTPSGMSTTFANNEGIDKLVVRNGPLAFSPGALPAGSSGAFGATIQFDRGYVYRGGDLCVTIKKDVLKFATTKLQGAGPASVVRGVYAPNRSANTGSFDSPYAGVAMQFGYIASDQTPSTTRFVRQDAGGGRFLFGGSRVHQNVFNPEVVGVPIGSIITAASWKLYLDSASPFPTQDVSYDRFDISLSSSPVRAENMTRVFAENEGADMVTVRSGPLTLPKNSYFGRTGSATNDFGLFLQFTKPFVYKGGPLTLTIRESAGSGDALLVNFESSSLSSNGVRNTEGPDALQGNWLGDGVVTRFAFTRPALCPGDLNNDGLVDDSDFVLFLAGYNTLDCADGAMAFGCPSDFNRDRMVDDADFTVFLAGYNALVCP